MRIWFPTITTGSGSDIYVKRLADGLVKQDQLVEISWRPHWQEACPVFLSNCKANFLPDIIHVNSWHGFPFAQEKIPLVVTCHHCVHDEAFQRFSTFLQQSYHKGLIKQFEKWSFQKAAKVITVSQYTASIVQEKFPFVEPVVISNGIETDFFTPSAKENKQNKKFKILFVGNASKRKGFDLLPEIMNKLGDSFQLFFTSGLRQNHHKLPENCIPLGMLSEQDLLQAYRTSDVIICPSRYEGFGYVVCEAMACGKAVVSSNSSALPELIEHKVNGLLCENENVDDFVAAIRLLADDNQLRTELGLAARVVAEQQYSIKNMVIKYLEQYSVLIEK